VGLITATISGLDLEAARRGNRQGHRVHDAGKKGKKGKKGKGKTRRKKRSDRGSVAPPPPTGPRCEDTSCPDRLPPGCEQQTLDMCNDSLHHVFLTDIESCRSQCADPESPACRSCLELIIVAMQPDAEACAGVACAGAHAAENAQVRTVGAVAADKVWVRQCAKPCCFLDLTECTEDFRDAYVGCMVLAGAGCFVSAGAACAAAVSVCTAGLIWGLERCNARWGCPRFGACQADDTCANRCNGRSCTAVDPMPCGTGLLPDGQIGWVCHGCGCAQSVPEGDLVCAFYGAGHGQIGGCGMPCEFGCPTGWLCILDQQDACGPTCSPPCPVTF
jgi:hypothetical protein